LKQVQFSANLNRVQLTTCSVKPRKHLLGVFVIEICSEQEQSTWSAQTSIKVDPVWIWSLDLQNLMGIFLSKDISLLKFHQDTVSFPEIQAKLWRSSLSYCAEEYF